MFFETNLTAPEHFFAQLLKLRKFEIFGGIFCFAIQVVLIVQFSNKILFSQLIEMR